MEYGKRGRRRGSSGDGKAEIKEAGRVVMENEGCRSDWKAMMMREMDITGKTESESESESEMLKEPEMDKVRRKWRVTEWVQRMEER